MTLRTRLRRWAVWRRLHLTPFGHVLLVGALAAAMLGVDTTRTTAYQVFSLLAALLLVAGLALRRLRVAAEVQRQLPTFATQGQPFSYVLTFSRLTMPTTGLQLFEQFRHDAAPTDLVEAHWTSDRQASVTWSPIRRGIWRSDQIYLCRTDPLGIFRTLSALPCPGRLIVLPAPLVIDPPRLPGQRRYQPGGISQSSSIGDSTEFIGLRDYRPGDPLHRIDWKGFARTGHPVVREYQDEYFTRYALVLDTDLPPRDTLRLDRAVAAAIALATQIDLQETLLDLMIVGTQTIHLTAGRGQLQLPDLLEILASAEARPGGLQALHTTLDTLLPQLTAVVLVLVCWNEDRQALVDTLRQQGVVVEVYVAEPLRTAGPAWLHNIP